MIMLLLSNWITPESLVVWLIRVTVLSGLACAYLALARNARPAMRHAVAVGGLVAIALLPLASGLLPSLSIPVLPGVTTATSPGTRGTASATRFAIDAPADATPAPVELQNTSSVEPSVSTRRIAPLIAAFRSVFTRTRIALLAWLMMAVALLLRIGIAAVGAQRLARRAWPTTDDRLILEHARALRVLGMTRAVNVAVSPEIAIPAAVGVVHPRVILPSTATEWSRERLGVVLLHELAHVRRRDCLWMFVARVVSAIVWFHPLVWALSRHVRRETERACDDIVLASGVRGSDYAEHLVSIARTSMLHDPLRGSAPAFAALSTLERRVASILSAGTPRSAMSRRALASLACASLVLFVAIAVAHPTAVVSAQPSPAEVLAAQNVYSEQPAVAAVPATPKVVYTYKNKFQYKAPAVYVTGNQSDQVGNEWYDRAHDFYSRGRFDRAGQAYEKAAENGYRRATALYNAGCSYALADKSAKAIDALQAAFDEGFDDPSMYAEDEDLNSLRDDPRFRDLLVKVMNSDEAQQNRRAATREYERLAARKDVEHGEWNSVGVDLMRSGDYDQATTAFDNEFKVSEDQDAIYNKACALALKGQSDGALKLLEQSIVAGPVDAEHMQEDPDLASLHSKKAFNELVDLAKDLELNGVSNGFRWNGNVWNGDDEKHWQKSIPRFEEVTREHPTIGRAWFNLGYAQLKADQPDKGAASFTKALDLKFRPATTMYNLACAAALSGNIDAAFSWLEKAEGAGMDVGSSARWDEDLDAIRGDARYKELKKRWKAEENERHREHDKDSDKERADSD